MKKFKLQIVVLLVVIFMAASGIYMSCCDDNTSQPEAPGGAYGLNAYDTGYFTTGSLAQGMANVTWLGGNTWTTLKPKVKHACMTVEDGDIRYKEIGTANTTSGHLVYEDTVVQWLNPNINYQQQLQGLSVIFDSSSSANATVWITVYN